MPSILQFTGQALVYGAAAALTGYLAASPVYHQVPGGQAQIKLALIHGGKRVEDCRVLTTEELSKLPSTQRRPNTCSRERLPVAVELSVDGAVIYAELLEPSGLARGGVSQAYRKFLVPAGRHVVEARLRDSKRSNGFDFEGRIETELKPWQNLAIDFSAEQGGFQFR